jgi:hypothetical protein
MQLRDVLDHEGFGLDLMVAGADAHSRAIMGMHVIEAVNPSRWVPPEWVVLTTGMRLRRNAPAQRQLIAELAESGVVALGFGVGIVFDTVPKSLLDEAAKRDFPVFAVPERTPFREMVQFVGGCMLSDDLSTFRRSASITDSLVQALGEQPPESALVARLARSLHCEASLHRVDGTLVSASGQGAGTRWQRLRELPLSPGPVEIVDVDGLFATAISVEGEIAYWLVLSVSRSSLAVSLILRALTVAGKLLEGLLGVRVRDVRHNRVRRAETLAAAVGLPANASPEESDRVRRRALDLGVDLKSTGRVALLFSGEPEDELGIRVERVLARARLPLLLGTHEGALAVWLADGIDTAWLVEEVGGPLIAGIGRPVRDPAGVRVSHGDARLALRRARQPASGPVVRYEDLPLLEWLVLQAGPELAESRARALLTPLEGQDYLLHTLRLYLRNSMSVPATARELQIHENSLRHRLNRVKALLGYDLHSPPHLAALYLALLLSSPDGEA